MPHFLASIKKHIFHDAFLWSSLIVFVASFFVNILNYIFTIFTARTVAIEIYGEFTTLLSLLILFSVPASAIGLFTSREISNIHADAVAKKTFINKIFSETILLSVFLWIFFVLFIPFLSQFLKIEHGLLFLFSVLLPLSLLSSFQFGYLQGEHDFVFSSFLNILSAVTKLFFSYIFLSLGFSIYGILTALILSGFLNIFSARKIYKQLSLTTKYFVVSDSLSHIISLTFLSSMFLAILGNLDVLLAKHFLSSFDAGAYGALSTMGKIIIFATGSFVTVMMPMVSRHHSDSPGSAHKLFQRSLFFMFSFGLAITLFFNFFSTYAVHMLFGLKYSLVAGYIGVFSFAMLAMALTISFINFFIATKNISFIYFLSAGLILELVLLWYNHSSIGEFVESVLVSTVCILVFMIINYVFIKKIKF